MEQFAEYEFHQASNANEFQALEESLEGETLEILQLALLENPEPLEKKLRLSQFMTPELLLKFNFSGTHNKKAFNATCLYNQLILPIYQKAGFDEIRASSHVKSELALNLQTVSKLKKSKSNCEGSSESDKPAQVDQDKGKIRKRKLKKKQKSPETSDSEAEDLTTEPFKKLKMDLGDEHSYFSKSKVASKPAISPNEYASRLDRIEELLKLFEGTLENLTSKLDSLAEDSKKREDEVLTKVRRLYSYLKPNHPMTYGWGKPAQNEAELEKFNNDLLGENGPKFVKFILKEKLPMDKKLKLSRFMCPELMHRYNLTGKMGKKSLQDTALYRKLLLPLYVEEGHEPYTVGKLLAREFERNKDLVNKRLKRSKVSQMKKDLGREDTQTEAAEEQNEDENDESTKEKESKKQDGQETRFSTIVDRLASMVSDSESDDALEISRKPKQPAKTVEMVQEQPKVSSKKKDNEGFDFVAVPESEPESITIEEIKEEEDDSPVEDLSPLEWLCLQCFSHFDSQKALRSHERIAHKKTAQDSEEKTQKKQMMPRLRDCFVKIPPIPDRRVIVPRARKQVLPK